MKNPWHDIKTDKLVAVIEIPKGSRKKYELNPKTRKMKLMRVLPKEFHYPLNYGFIPKTLAKDKDPLDIMILGRKVNKSTKILVKPIALLKLTDQKVSDDKILAIPENDAKLRKYKDIKDIPNSVLKNIEQFFKHYKDSEGKKVKVIKWLNKKQAEKEIKKAKESYKRRTSSLPKWLV